MESNLMFAVALVGLACTTGLVALWLLNLSRDSPTEPTSRLFRSRFEIQLEKQGFSKRTLILASLLGLFLELMLIRWVSSEIRTFAYFKNFVLMACFLGFGLGCSPVSPQDQPAARIYLIGNVDVDDQASLGTPADGY
jgi:hypothetical protein